MVEKWVMFIPWVPRIRNKNNLKKQKFPLNPGWLVGITMSWYIIYNPYIHGQYFIPYIIQPTNWGVTPNHWSHQLQRDHPWFELKASVVLHNVVDSRWRPHDYGSCSRSPCEPQAQTEKWFQERYNTPLEHTPDNPPRQLWKESLYGLSVEV